MLTDVVDTQLVDVVTHINSDDYDVMSSFCREPISIMLFDVFDGRFPHEAGLGYCFSFSHTHTSHGHGHCPVFTCMLSH